MFPDFLVGSLLILVVIVAVVAFLVVTGMERGRRANLRAEAANARLAELNAAAAAAGQSLDLRQVFSDTLTVVLGRPSVRSAWIAYAPQGEGSPSVTALAGSPPTPLELPERFLRATHSVMANSEPCLLGAPDLTPSPADADLVTAVVPVWADDRLVGAFGVSSQGNNPLAYDIEHLNDISWQLGLAVDNVQRYQEARESLRELTRTQAALEGYVRLATEAQEEERKRLARELHDETIQSLVIIKGYLETAAANGGVAEIQLESAAAMLTRTIDGLRRMTRDLRPAILDDLGLHHAIESLVAEFTDRTGIHVTVTANDSRRRLDPKTELVLFRIAQEALRNVEKHSGAGHVSLDLHVEKDGATLRVADDGRGFEPGKLSIERDDATGLGLPGMQERAKSIDGTLRVKSHPGQGTLIEVRVASR
jgi:signal transduction histidine kinase